MENIKVAVRVRPLIGAEITSCTNCIHVADNQLRLDRNRVFAFDNVFSQETETQDVYLKVAFPLVEAFTSGFNTTIMCYGQTGAGKTHTMTHIMDEAVKEVFRVLGSGNAAKGNVELTILEIYNDQLIDLLDVNAGKTVTLRETDRGTSAVGMRAVTVVDADEAAELIERGTENRRTASTLMNAQSSRSHCIATLELTYNGTCSRMNFVDLAGSERIKKSHSYNGDGARVREGISINSGLLELGNVITALCNKDQHVPFRNSKLTRVLQDSLAGNSRTAMIACVSPADTSFEESLSTVKYAYRAKSIETKPMLNVAPTTCISPACAETIQKLRQELLEVQAVLKERGLENTSRTVVLDAATAETKEYQKTIVTLEEDLAKEKRMTKQLEDDLYDQEFKVMQLNETKQLLMNENEELRVRLLDADQGASTAASTPTSAAPNGNNNNEASREGSKPAASPIREQSSAAARQWEALRSLELERDRLLAEKCLNEQSIQDIRGDDDDKEEPSVEDLSKDVEEKMRQIAELEERNNKANNTLLKYQQKLDTIASDREKLLTELHSAETKLEQSQVEQEKKERQRREIKASFEARMKAAEVQAAEYRKRVREARQVVKAQQADQERIRKLQLELKDVRTQMQRTKEAARLEHARTGKLKAAHTQEVTTLHKRVREHEMINVRLEKQLQKKEAEIAKARSAMSSSNSHVQLSVTTQKIQTEIAAIQSLDAELAAAKRERDEAKAAIAQATQPEMAARIRRSLTGWQVYAQQLRDSINEATVAGDDAKKQIFENELEITLTRMAKLEQQIPLGEACEEHEAKLREVEDRIDSLEAAKEFKTRTLRNLQRNARCASTVAEESGSTARARGAIKRAEELESENASLKDKVTALESMLEAQSQKADNQAKLLESLLPKKWSGNEAWTPNPNE